MVSLNKFSIFISSDSNAPQHFRTARHQALIAHRNSYRQSGSEHPYTPGRTPDQSVSPVRAPLCENNNVVNSKTAHKSPQHHKTHKFDSPYFEFGCATDVKLYKHLSSPTQTQQFDGALS